MKHAVRPICLIASVCILLAMFPITSSACSTVSGVFGDHLTWKLNTRSGKMTISGNGEMPDCSLYEVDDGDYYYWSSMPWVYMHLSDQIKSVTIKQGVTSIGDNAFAFCDALTEVSLPEGLYRIGDTAFEGCGLRSVTIPASVSVIGALAFADCDLHSITIPDSVSGIYSSAFKGCKNLAEIQIENAHGFYIDGTAFDDTAYYNNPSNWENGLLYIENHLIRCGQDVKGVCTVRPGTVTIAGDVFGNSYEYSTESNRDQITEIVLPDSIEFIGSYAELERRIHVYQ